MTDIDKKCADIAISLAEKSLLQGNYPVGAVLVFDDEIVAQSNNEGETSKNYVNHAETKMIIENGEGLLQASRDNKVITLYSTLEPCLMCLGISVMNKINRIVYLQKDPHAGACGIDRKSLGARYQEVWPEINYIEYSDKPKQLIISFLNKQIESGIRVEWSKNFLKLLGIV